MELSQFLDALRRSWLVPVACLLVGVIATSMYHFFFTSPQAITTVAVLASSSSRSPLTPEASFDQVVKSGLLADRVSRRIGESSADVRRHIWVTLLPGLSLTTPSAIYAVHGQDTSLGRAEKLVTAVVEEAKAIYLSINATSGSELQGALDSEVASMRTKATAAEGAFVDFQQQNDAIDLPNRIASQRATVAALNALRQQNEADQAAYYNVNYALYKAAVNRQATLTRDVNSAQAELDRLVKLQPQYQALDAAMLAAEAQLNVADSVGLQTVLGQILPAVSTITVLDPAQPESDWVFTTLTYVLGVVAGLILGLSIVYVRALTGGRIETAEAAASAFGATVLSRIPVRVVQ